MNYNPVNSNDNTSNQKRRYPRRAHDVCMINVDGHPYPVLDWSQCGVLFEADSRIFNEGQTVNMILRFKVGNQVQDVKVTGEIVRKNNTTVATTFNNLEQEILDSFQKVIASSAA